MKLLALLSIIFLTGFTRIYDLHDSPDKIDGEFRNIEIGVQPKGWRVFSSTPSLYDLEDDECVKVSSNIVSIMCRDSNDIYSIKLSCVTVIR